ncbi:hypothetical protein dsat_0409 [Alkalidesulfovibrio alkalitolerans DSM 16529]|uniref:Uncharacterized protein n=1 Tax=Alkalidesulfovibrio alkalitolerans DSM 16529 TaxID=1121439 RepID=S7UKX2_9BACT|nr:hypothetical protein [Alkalidesulfovibrio alkalitolerans]EPR32968.1 hypothetical protein dsat_0409 [Alkalidesulfovibrio alkalitolerans DSM 16529]
MRAREMYTQFDLIASNYTITDSGGLFLHRFTPQGTDTIYQIETTSRSPVIVEGDRYDVGFKNVGGIRIVDPSSICNSSKVSPKVSVIAAFQIGREIYNAERAKNDERVIHSERSGYWWGKKYAWRVYGLCLAKESFYKYLEEIRHPTVNCEMNNPPHPRTKSIAYLDDGICDAVEELMETAVARGRFYVSPKFSKNFSIKGINAMTDKK